jgi:hypothetical protein
VSFLDDKDDESKMRKELEERFEAMEVEVKE